MANKQILSIVAASILAASFTLTGCGSSSSSSSSSSSVAPASSDAALSSEASSSSEATTEPISVTAFRLLEANVTKGGVENTITNATQYEFPEGTTGVLATIGGAYDVNGDNNATSADAKAPALAGPATFSNINALSTLEAQGVSIDDINAFYGISLETSDIVIDPADVAVYAANAKATLKAAGYTGDAEATSSDDSVSSSDETSSEAASSDASNPYPASVLRESPYPEEPSSDAQESSEEAASSSSEATGSDTAYADIDACTDAMCIDAIVGAKLIELNGSYGSNTSSEDATSSEAASSEEETSSEAASSDASNPYPAPAL